jgi:TRAP-type C4-dicarboxylate transport system substrate-binding protein
VADTSDRIRMNGIICSAQNRQMLWPDLKNKKVRTFSVAIEDFYAALGGIPVSLPFAEVYTALSRGTVDAVQTASGNALGIKLWEVAPYTIDVRAGAGPRRS